MPTHVLVPELRLSIRQGIAGMMGVSLPSVKVLVGPTIYASRLDLTIRFVEDKATQKWLHAAMAANDANATERANRTLKNIEAALMADDALSDLVTLDGHITGCLRERGGRLMRVDVEGLTVNVVERSWVGDTVALVAAAHRARLSWDLIAFTFFHLFLDLLSNMKD